MRINLLTGNDLASASFAEEAVAPKRLREAHLDRSDVYSRRLFVKCVSDCVGQGIRAWIDGAHVVPDILEAFPPEDFSWSVKAGQQSAFRVSRTQEALNVMRPDDGFLAALNLRSLGDRDSGTGSASWLEGLMSRKDRKGASALYQYLRDSLTWIDRTDNHQARLLLEKVFVLYPTRRGCASNSITPQLHTDADYGQLEAASASFSLSNQPQPGTLFFPHFNMQAYKDLRPITLDKLHSLPSDLTKAYHLCPGDLAIYSGKINRIGQKEPFRGLYHASPDQLFETPRLVLLFRVRYAL